MNINEAEARRAYLIDVLRFDMSEKAIETVDKMLRELNLPPLKKAEISLPLVVQEQKEKMLPEQKQTYLPAKQDSLPLKYFA